MHQCKHPRKPKPEQMYRCEGCNVVWRYVSKTLAWVWVAPGKA